MKRISKIFESAFLLVIVPVLVTGSSFAQERKIQVIYGKDDRMDVYQVSDPAIVNLASSSAAMVSKLVLQSQNQSVKILGKTYGETNNLCKDESYYSQPNVSFCSGFLVGPDLMVTAGHCISQRDCGDWAFVFNYKMNGPGKNPDAVSLSDVYSCKDVVAREQTKDRDYAIVRLDRAVSGHSPVVMSATPARKGDSLFTIGNPAGLPLKISGGGVVRKEEQNYFVNNLDSFGGDSGAVVYNAKTYEAVGLIVHGEEDYQMDFARNCMKVNKCTEAACRGEDAINIDVIRQALLSIH